MGILQTRVVVERRESDRILYKWSKRGLSRSRAYVNQSESANIAVHQKKDTLVAPVNNFLHSIFNQVDGYFNKKLVSPANNAYPYRAYLESLLNYGPTVKSSH